jgi:hypothetical protein
MLWKLISILYWLKISGLMHLVILPSIGHNGILGLGSDEPVGDDLVFLNIREAPVESTIRAGGCISNELYIMKEQ